MLLLSTSKRKDKRQRAWLHGARERARLVRGRRSISTSMPPRDALADKLDRVVMRYKTPSARPACYSAKRLDSGGFAVGAGVSFG